MSDIERGAPSEMRRGWPLVFAAAVGVGTGRSALMIYSLGVFTKAIAAEFGWGRGEVQSMLAFSTMGVLIGSPLLGTLMDRRGVRSIVLVSTVAFAVTFAMIGPLTNSVITFYALGFVCSIVGAGTLPVTWSRAIFEWFSAQRGFALGLALMGSGFAAFLLPPYAGWLLGQFGWRLGYVGIGLLPLVLSLPLSFFLLKPPPVRAAATKRPEAETGLSLREAVRGFRFWVLGVSFFLASFATGGITAHLVPMMTDRGYDLKTAAWIAGTQGLAVIAGRAVTGYLLDKLWAPALAAVVLVLPTASCFVLAAGVESVPISLAAVILVGFAAGAEFDMVAFLTARYFGLKYFGALYGVLYAFFISASGFAPGIFGRVFDLAGNYTVILNISAFALVAGAGLVLVLGRYPHWEKPAA
jgi:MFS family permease